MGISPPALDSAADRRFMQLALSLAERQLGTTAPNPAVGCVIVRGRTIVGRGATAPGGRPHAETIALAQAGDQARGATAYVSLEPCAHHGQTPPCADALVTAAVGRVVVAVEDPDPRVSGRGIDRLKAAGLLVEVGVRAGEAEAVNAGFFLRVREGRPLMTLKTATSLDGRIATHTGESRWITAERARAFGHLLRAGHDAILVGSSTVLVDDPELTCRIPGLEDRSPVRVIADGRLRVGLTSTLVRTAKSLPTLILTRPDAPSERRAVLQECGVDVIEVAPGGDGGLDPQGLVRALGSRGLTRVLVEGGAALAAELLRAGVIDRVAWFRSGAVLGGDGVPALAPFGVDSLADAPWLKSEGGRMLGPDRVDFYAVKP